MTTLRARLAALFAGAILAVVALATSLIFVIFDRPQADQLLSRAHFVLALAGKTEALRRFDAAKLEPDPRPTGFYTEPAAGQVIEAPTHHLREALRRSSVPFDVVVTMPDGGDKPVISLKISENEWLVLPAEMAAPASPWPDMGGWLVLIIAGATGIAVMAVYRMTQPLALVQRTVANIGPSGDAPMLAETGPPEVRAMARAINALSKRLKGAMESRMRLVAAAGHDLRTPMTRMRLRAEFFESEERDKWIADLDELDHIADSAIRLVHEETEAAPEDIIRLDELVREVTAELQELRFDVRLERLQPASVRVRPLSLKRALRNLIINAATHGKGAVVAVNAAAGRAEVSIGDSGPGIPEPLLTRAGEPFFRVDPARKPAIPGAGLGLAIAKEIIARSNGRLDLANRPGGGLQQRIELPLAEGEL